MLWKGFRALMFGHRISAGFGLVAREQTPELLSERGAKQAGLASFFGFIFSSRFV
jgi:hypothetical protein